MDADAKRDELTKRQIQTDVELKLRQGRHQSTNKRRGFADTRRPTSVWKCQHCQVCQRGICLLHLCQF
jgi:hypothetical protein